MSETGCQKCGACCKWLGFSYKGLSPESIEFYHERGCEILYAERIITGYMFLCDAVI
jgi:hypothetical protein